MVLEKDRLIVDYHPDKVTPERLLRAVRQEGFEGKIVSP